MEIKPGKLVMYAGIFSLAFSLFFVYGIIKIIDENIVTILLLLSMFLILSLTGIYSILHFKFYRIEVNENSIKITNELNNTKEIYWKEIDNVSYNRIFKMIKISRIPRNIWISQNYFDFVLFVPDNKLSDKLK